MPSTTASPFPIPLVASTNPRRSLRSRLRASLVLAVIAGFAGTTPLAYAFTLWSATALFPRLASYGLPSPPTSTLHYSLLAYFAVEAAFGVTYHLLAYKLQQKPPAKFTDRRELRNVVRTVLESNMGSEPGSPISSCSSRASSRRSSIAEFSSLRSRANAATPDSGYGTDTSDDSGKVTLTPLREVENEPATGYSFLSAEGQGLERDDPRAVDFRESARHWFYGAPIEDLRRDNLSSWLSWCLFGQPHAEIVHERRMSLSQGVDIGTLPRENDIGRDKLETVEHSLGLWEARTGIKLPEGKNPDVDVVRLTLDPVRVLSRPLALYCAIWLAQQFYRYKLRSWGFEEQSHGGMKYFVRTPQGWEADHEGSEETRPLVFLHGLGIGPVQYAPILNRFAKDKAYAQRPVAILIQPHLSMSLFNPRYLSPPAAAESSASLVAMSKANNFHHHGLTVVSHSNGTIVHGWLVKAAPDLVARSLFLDPVCFALWEPSLPYNFLYAAAKSPMQLLMRYFVARELGVANTLQRNFDWMSSLVTPADIPHAGDPSKASIYFSERDSIVDTSRVTAYLAGEGMAEHSGVTVFPKLKHGEALMGHGRHFRRITSWIQGEE